MSGKYMCQASLIQCVLKRRDERRDPLILHLHADLVYDDPRGQRADLLEHGEAVLAQRRSVSTMSQMTSESPTIGASSIEPFSLMISTV